MLLGAAIAAAIAFVLSFPLFRMKGFYFLIGSFAAGEVIRLPVEAVPRAVRRAQGHQG